MGQQADRSLERQASIRCIENLVSTVPTNLESIQDCLNLPGIVTIALIH